MKIKLEKIGSGFDLKDAFNCLMSGKFIKAKSWAFPATLKNNQFVGQNEQIFKSLHFNSDDAFEIFSQVQEPPKEELYLFASKVSQYEDTDYVMHSRLMTEREAENTFRNHFDYRKIQKIEFLD